MIKYIEFADFSLFIYYLAKELGFDFQQIISEKKFSLPRIKASEWNDIFSNLQTEDMFVETGLFLIVDLQNLDLDEKNLAFLQKIVAETKVFLYSSEKDLTAEQKKLCKKLQIEIENLKSASIENKQHFGLEYAKSINLQLSSEQIKKISEQAENYFEIIDNLDFISLADDQSAAYQTLLKQPDLPIFMLSFNTQKVQSEAVKWYNKISEEDIQLGLSLLYTKLTKQTGPTSENIKELVVQTDRQIKTRGGFFPIIWWKLFLWKCSQEG